MTGKMEGQSFVGAIFAENPGLESKYENRATPDTINLHCHGLARPYGVARIAVEKYTARSEMERFYREFTDFVMREGNFDTREAARRSADDILGYCTGYAGNETAQKWFNALPTIRHPVYGRDLTLGIRGNISDFYIVIKGNDAEEIKEDVDSLVSSLGMETYDVEDMAEESKVLGIKIKASSAEENRRKALLLYGVIQGVKMRYGKPDTRLEWTKSATAEKRQ